MTRTLKLIALLLVIITGCRKPSGANWDVDVVLPIVNSTMNIRNFAGDTLFGADNSGLLHLIYNRQVAAIMMDSLLKLPDTTIHMKFPDQPIPFTYTLNPGDKLPFTDPVDLKFNISNGVQLTRVDVRNSTLNLKFSNTASQPVDLIYQLPGAIKNGARFTISETVPPGINSLQKSYDLSGYSISMRGVSGKDVNAISQTYTITVNPNADTLVLQPGQGAEIDVTYSEIVPQYVEGYFGNSVIKMQADTTRINLAEEFRPTNFMLSEATMAFRIVNEFGADFRANIYNVKSINTHDAKVITLATNKLSAININRAVNNGSAPVSTTWSTVFNSSNSNIVPFISNLPDELTYQGEVQINPPPLQNTQHDFAYYKTGLRIFADIDIPLRFTADNFRLETNAGTDFTNVEQLNNVNSGNFIINVTNGFPFAARLQAYMVDAAGVVIDSMLVAGQNLIAAGQYVGQNPVETPAFTQLQVPLGEGRIENLKKCKSVKISTLFIMPGAGAEVTIYDHYTIDVKIIAELNYHVGIRRKD
jgi:hypothetical protein